MPSTAGLSAKGKIWNIVLLLLGLFLVMAGIVSAKIDTPEFQSFIGRQVVNYLSKKLNTEVTIGEVHFKLFHHLELHDLLVRDLNRDTLLAARTVEVTLGLIDLLQSRYVIKSVVIDQSRIFLHKEATGSGFNFQFILDSFSGGKPGTTQPTSVELGIGELVLRKMHLELLDEPNQTHLDLRVPEANVQVHTLDIINSIINLKEISFSQPLLSIQKLGYSADSADIPAAYDPAADTAVVHINTKPLQLLVGNFRFEDAEFRFDDLNEKTSEGRFDGFHQWYRELDFTFRNGSLVMDTVRADITHISFIEKSGFAVKHLETKATVTPTAAIATDLKIETPHSLVSNYFGMKYINFHAFYDFNTSVSMDVILNESTFATSDLAMFVPPAAELPGTVRASGNLSGTLDNLKGKGMQLETASVTSFKGDIDLKGLPDIAATFIDLKVDAFTTNSRDVQYLVQKTTLPDEFSKLGTINFQGSFTGFFNDFVAYGVMNTRLGIVRSDLNMKFEDRYEQAAYSGNLAMQEFDIGSYAGLDSLMGTISFDARISGKGLVADKAEAYMNGEVQQFIFNGYNYRNLAVDGEFTKKLFTGKLELNDENINLLFKGLVDFTQELPVYNFHASMENAQLNKLGFTDSLYTLTTQLDLDMRGDHIDNLIGKAIAVNSKFTKPGQSLSLDTVLLHIAEQDGNKHFLLSTPPGSASFTGKFALTKLPGSFLAVLDHYFPSLPVDQTALPVEQDFDFDIRLHDVTEALHFFLPSWSGLSHSLLHGHFNSSRNDISFAGTIPAMGYGDFKLDTLDVEASTAGNRFHCSAISSFLYAGGSVVVLHPSFRASVSGDSARVDVHASNMAGSTYMDLTTLFLGDTTGFQMKVLPSALVLNEKTWTVSEDNYITYTDQRLRFNNFTLSHADRALTVSNVNLRPRATNLHFDFNGLPLEDLNTLINQQTIDLAGDLSGSMELLNVFNSPRVKANTHVSSLVINNNRIAETVLNINYRPEDDQVGAQLLITDPSFDIRAAGSYYPRKAQEQFNFDIDVRKFDLHFFESLLPGFFSNTAGLTEGMLHLSGTPSDPLLTGELTVPELSVKVEYLQTTYSIVNQKIIFNQDHIDIGKMKLTDENEFTANARGQIYHNHLRDFRFNLAVTTERFQMLNTTEKDNSLFYGSAIASGIVQFLGPLDDMEIQASLNSMKGTEIAIPIKSGASIGDRSFIRYVKRQNDTAQNMTGRNEILPGLRLNFDLDMTPDARIRIIFDQKAGDIITGTGKGNIRMEINTKGDFNMYGTYTIEEGDYLFTLQNFFNKFFTIDEGGTISWTGDPYEAQIAIDAIYSTKASVYDLAIGSGIAFSDNEIKELQRHIPVRVALKLSGSLLLPDVAFDISLPDETTLSSATYQEIQKVKQDESELNKQVFGLLLLNRFLPSNSGSGNQNFGADVNNSVSEFLLNQLSYWTSQIRSDIDFDFNYQSYEAKLNATNPNDLTKRNELEVALTKRFLNDRLALEAGGNFDFAGANTGSASGENSTNIAGDFAVDYKITPDGRLSGKAFSKSQYDVVDERYKTKNGIALSYKREFNKIRELFEKDLERQKQKEERKLLKEEMKHSDVDDTPVTAQ